MKLPEPSHSRGFLESTVVLEPTQVRYEAILHDFWAFHNMLLPKTDDALDQSLEEFSVVA